MGVQSVQISTTGLVPNTSGLGIGMTQQLPTVVYIETTDTLATVLTSGYLNESQQRFQVAYNNYQMALVYTTDNKDVWLRVSVTTSAGINTYSLVYPAAISVAGLTYTGTLTVGDILKVSNASGILVDANIAAAELMQLNAANTMTGSGQITLAKANGTEASNLVTASGNAGLITTSSLTVTAGSTYAITWTNTLITSTSTILLSWEGGTNTEANFTMRATRGTGTSTLTIYNNAPVTSISGTILIGYAIL